MKTAVVFILGMFLGAAGVVGFEVAWSRPVEERKLTKDVEINKLAYRDADSPRVIGVLRKGSVLILKGVKGGAAYISFETTVGVDVLPTFSVPYDPFDRRANSERRTGKERRGTPEPQHGG